MFPSRRARRLARVRASRAPSSRSRVARPVAPRPRASVARRVDARRRFVRVVFIFRIRARNGTFRIARLAASASRVDRRLSGAARAAIAIARVGVAGDIARSRVLERRVVPTRARPSPGARWRPKVTSRVESSSRFRPVNTTLRASSAFMYTFGTRRDRGFAPVNTTLRASSACRDLVSLSSEGVTHGSSTTRATRPRDDRAPRRARTRGRARARRRARAAREPKSSSRRVETRGARARARKRTRDARGIARRDVPGRRREAARSGATMAREGARGVDVARRLIFEDRARDGGRRATGTRRGRRRGRRGRARDAARAKDGEARDTAIGTCRRGARARDFGVILACWRRARASGSGRRDRG